jgi:hypothetical protein
MIHISTENGLCVYAMEYALFVPPLVGEVRSASPAWLEGGPAREHPSSPPSLAGYCGGRAQKPATEDGMAGRGGEEKDMEADI